MASIYNIGINYVIAGNAQAGLKSMQAQAKITESSLLSLKNVLGSLGIGLGIAALFQTAKKHLIDFNNTMVENQIAISAALTASFGTPFDEAMKKADKFKERLLQFSGAAPGGVQDYVAGFVKFAAAARGTNATDERILSLSERVTAATQLKGIFGDQGEIVMQEITKSLSGAQLKHAGPIMTFFNMAGIDLAEWNKMTQAAKFKSLEEHMAKSVSFAEALKKEGQTMGAQMESLKNNIDLAFGKAGLPVTQAITEEIKRWNTWFENNEASIRRWATDFGGKLVEGFNTVKSIFSTIYEYKDTLLTIATLYAGIKVGGAVGQMAGSLIASMENLGKNTSTLNTNILSLVGAFAGLMKVISDMVDDKRKEMVTQRGSVGGLGQHTGMSNADLSIAEQSYKELNMLRFKANGMLPDPMSKDDFVKRMYAVHSTNPFLMGEYAEKSKTLDKLYQQYIKVEERIAARTFMIDKSKTDEEKATKALPPVVNLKPNINVKIEVVSEDPDRFAIELNRQLGSLIRRPTTSMQSRREGF